MHDGRFANNAWLQELPKPLTKLTWDNAGYVSPRTAERHGLANGDIVELHLRGRVVRAPVWIVPGHTDGCVSLTMGYGRAVGRVAHGAGVLLLVMVLTMLVPEKRLAQVPMKMDWTPYLRLLLMTVIFSVIIFGLGELVKILAGLLPVGMTLPVLLFWMGVAGLAGMLVAVFLGVWLGVRTSLGEAAIHNTGFTWWVVNRLAFLVGMVNLSTFAVFYFQSRLGYSEMQAAKPAAQLIQVVGVMIFLAALAGGWLADRLGHRRILFISGVGAAAGSLIILFTKDLSVITVGGGVIGLAAGLFYSSNWALGTELAPKEEAARRDHGAPAGRR